MGNRLLYFTLGVAAGLAVSSVTGRKPITKNVYKGLARANRGLQRLAAGIREDLEDARAELQREEAGVNQ
jgi:hypothetical protein